MIIRYINRIIEFYTHHFTSVSPRLAPVLPPAAIRVTLIEKDAALVSWKPPDEHNVAVTRYTILYASRRAWLAGEWQIQQKEGR